MGYLNMKNNLLSDDAKNSSELDATNVNDIYNLLDSIEQEYQESFGSNDLQSTYNAATTQNMVTESVQEMHVVEEEKKTITQPAMQASSHMDNASKLGVPFNATDIYSALNSMSFAYDELGSIVSKEAVSVIQIPDSFEKYESIFSPTDHQSLLSQSDLVNVYNIPKFGLNDFVDISRARNDFPILQSDLVWLDNAATTQKPKDVIDSITNYYTHSNSNIHRGDYKLSMEASQMYEDVRKMAAKFINASSDQDIVFVRGTTEGINMIATSLGKSVLAEGDEVVIGSLEHHANILPWQKICRDTGAVLKVAPVDKDGNIMLDAYESILNSKTKIVAIGQVSNAIGAVMPVQQMTAMAKKYGAYVLIDGAQSVPHMAVDVQQIGCDFFVFSGHKMFAPTGIGIVYGKNEILNSLPPWQVGGGMIDKVTYESATYAPAPYKFEAGTGSIASVYGLGAAFQYLEKIGMDNISKYESYLLNYLLQQLRTVPGVRIMGNPTNRASVATFVMDGVADQDLGAHLNKRNIALRIGHHCAQPTMSFFGVKSMIRPSLAFYNNLKDIDALINALMEL